MIAAVGTDGARMVVWGLGVTEADALADASRQEHGGETLSCHEITAEQVAVVEAGDVSWPVV